MFESDNPKAIPLQFRRCTRGPHLLRARHLRPCQGLGRFLDSLCRHRPDLLGTGQIRLGRLQLTAPEVERRLRAESEFRHEG